MLSDPGHIKAASLSNSEKRTKEKRGHWAIVLGELLLAVGLLEWAIWSTDLQTRLVAGALSGCLMIHCFCAFGRWPSFQLRRPSITSLNILGVTLAISVLVGVICYGLDLWTPNLEFFSQRTASDWLLVKIPTVVLQQVLFQLVFVPAILFLSGSRFCTVVLSALVFAGLHCPNPLLILLTLLIGLFWFSTVVDQPRLITLTISHLVLAVVVANAADEYVLDMRVGQVCFQKWPERVSGQADGRTLLVYPRPLSGEILRVSQKNRTVTLSGRVFDKSRGKAPETVFIVFGEFDPTDENGASWIPQRVKSIRVTDLQGYFETDVDSESYCGSAELRLFARHHFGWTYPINDSTRVNIETSDPSGEAVCLHPKQVHGNIGHIRKRKGTSELIGWGFSWVKHRELDNLLWYHENRLVSLPLERRPRKEIANYFEDHRLMNCGFVSQLPADPISDNPLIYVRNSSGELERINMELSHPMRSRTAQQRQKYR